MGYIDRFRKSLKYILFMGVVVYLGWLIWLAIGFYLVKSNYKQEHHNLNISNTVKINRDAHAIPFIEAESKADAIFGLGFVHAQDRYWQMMMMREAAKGKLASHFGQALLNHDRFVKTLDLEGLAKKTYANQLPETKAYLERYASGINAWRSQHESDLLPLTPENFIFQIRFEPWQPEDCILVQKLMNFDLTDKGLQSLKTMWLMQQLTEPQLSSVFPDLKPVTNQSWPKLEYISEQDDINEAGASNAFAMTDTATTSGVSMLASDPHLKWTAPSMWMLVSMTWGDQVVSGGSMPGMPVIFIGRNSDLAWGVTMTGSDDQDINLIKIDQDNQYRGPNGKHKLNSRQIDIKVKNAANFSETVFSTPHGVVIDPALYGFQMDPQGDDHLHLQWTGFETSDHYLDFQWALMGAKSIDDIDENLQRFVIAPNTNLMLADKHNIKMIVTGQLPKRDYNHPTQGRYPGDYADSKTHWKGLFSHSINPKVQPKRNILVNTNNRTTTEAFPKNVTFNWIDYYRIRRVDEVVSNTNVFKPENVQNLQLDITSYKAKWLGSLLLYHLNRDTVSAHFKPIVKAMQAWQGHMNEHRFEPLFYHVWLSNFKKKIYGPYIGNHGRDIEMLNPRFIESLLKNPKIQKKWCKSDCNQEVNEAFDESIQKMITQFGDDFEGWQWGRLHSAKHEHPTLGKMPFINLIANIQHPISGDADTLNMAKALDEEDGFYTARKGAGLRVFIDFSMPKDSIYMITSTGQSGHLLSKFYRDQNELWRRGQYLLYNPNKVESKYQTILSSH